MIRRSIKIKWVEPIPFWINERIAPIENKFVTPEETLDDEFNKQLDMLKSLEQKRLLAAARIEQQKEKMKQKSLMHKQPEEYEIGDKVLILPGNII